jgi:hypothetical protein
VLLAPLASCWHARPCPVIITPACVQRPLTQQRQVLFLRRSLHPGAEVGVGVLDEAGFGDVLPKRACAAAWRHRERVHERGLAMWCAAWCPTRQQAKASWLGLA